jgi:hypothetical protein
VGHTANVTNGVDALLRSNQWRVTYFRKSHVLARALAERVFAYVRGAVQEGRHTRPISAHLDFAGA